MIPEINVSEFPQMAQFLKENNIKNIELIPYHRLGDAKYDALNIGFESFTVPSEEEMKKLKLIFN